MVDFLLVAMGRFAIPDFTFEGPVPDLVWDALGHPIFLQFFGKMLDGIFKI